MNDREILDDFDEFDEFLTDKESNVNTNVDSAETDTINEEESNEFLDNFENSTNNNIEDNQNIEGNKDLVENSVEEVQPIEDMDITNEVNANTEESNSITKEELENPIVEMVNNKTTMKLIIVMLAVLFIAVMFMPTIINFIKDLIK